MNKKLQRIINKSGQAKCEICNEYNILVEHHIRGRKIPNPNNYSNLSNICSNCHTKVHHGIIIIENRIMTTEGPQLIWHHYNDQSFTGDDAKPHLIQ